MIPRFIFQKQIKPEYFHDNRLGAALDQMGEAGMGMLYSKLIAKAIMKYSRGLEKLHFDTTSISLYGAYEQEEDGDDILELRTVIVRITEQTSDIWHDGKWRWRSSHYGKDYIGKYV